MMLTYKKTTRSERGVFSMLPVLFLLFACTKAPERPPLSLAAEHGDLPGVQHQLNEGADIGAKDDTGLDALSYAVINEHPEVVQYLLIRGADANTTNVSGITPMIIAATVGDLAIVQTLQQHGAAVNQATRDGITPLMAAVASDNWQTAELLLSYGADPCMRDRHSLTARQTADQWHGRQETSRVIGRNRSLALLNCNRN
ncbi:ankyrin repeat domain-containing protein [Paraburkholderia caledonica]|uniref:ankyrin repeat domain-containing protein n=1 Tax=Paraburkholderia caledonica TaxID=134536 RepID=UPI000DEF9D11|nr:hypothetical protein CUJ87_31770 [Paraburkholderia caledonica]